MMHPLAYFAGLACAFTALGCGTVSQSIPAPFPVLVGPIEHIGGAPVAVVVDTTTPTIELTNESGAGLCVSTLVPFFDLTRPSTAKMPETMHGSFAAVAGTAPLKEYVVRTDRIGVGAWEFYIAGCWARSTWWKHEGQLVRVSK